ncbi:Amidohydrolase [Penicillium paradoxum]|uniref:Amidohydrolase n=1 Tax=Penicillium paradoxum TaxID=176176 RepID=UPI00254783CC|nr:Amidohydrolase [Penicillium paradoxum]KAJ5773048.1 Amidohydrolase [Penicillium paradoxum]
MQLRENINQDLGEIISRHRPDLKPFEDVYRHLHTEPELSGQEEQTAKIASDHLKAAGFEVHTKIGGHGVAGILRNGNGPTILLRADMDALPVEEQTGLPYASTKHVKDVDGSKKPVMHACGHDSHVATLMAAATLLQSARKHWSGTLICIFQPAEEHLNGAQAMLNDGLYDRIPKPDVVLAQHVTRMRAGTINLRAGPFLTAADSFDVRVFGRGGHGSAPHTTIDPIVIGASIVTRLQTIVSREVTPGKLAVVTCGSIHAGSSPNIIPAYLDLQLNVRTYDENLRKRICASIHRIIEAECKAAGAVQKPEIKLVSSSPSTINDGRTIDALRETFQPYFGDDLVDMEPPTASEDFSLLATAAGAPYVIWMFGGTDSQTWEDAVAKGTVDELPSNHSPFFAPVIQPTLRTGVDAIALGALTFLKKQK